jgi:uncharacterized repeat protein (TIGR03803 family)
VTNTPQQQISRMRLGVVTVALILAVALALGAVPPQAAHAQTFTVLHNFNGGGDGESPSGQPVVDEDGNVFGTDTDFGFGCCGTVWEYSSGGLFSVLHSFDNWDGAAPFGLKLDKKGNMFGTTAGGGSHGHGTAFEITSGGTFATLYNFGSRHNDPSTIDDGVTLDASGNLYGMSLFGGSSKNFGTVWKLSRTGSETVLHRFDGSDGANPVGGNLRFYEQGNLYGVASGGGATGNGTLFEITSGGGFSVLYNFTGGSDGCLPNGSLLEYGGVLYGIAASCGSDGHGTVWQYNIRSATLTVLHAFSGADGAEPNGGVGCQQRKKTVCAGNLFGTTVNGGTNNDGTVWEIDATGTFSTLHNFANSDGASPWDRPFVDKEGNVYGTTTGGGSYGEGTLWEITAAKKSKRR